MRAHVLGTACRRLATVALLGALACGRGEPRLLPPAEATAAVTDLLYRDNLITDPEVNARMNEYVLQVSRDGRSVDAVIPVFHAWLAGWARDHPDRVTAARARGGAQAGPP